MFKGNFLRVYKRSLIGEQSSLGGYIIGRINWGNINVLGYNSSLTFSTSDSKSPSSPPQPSPLPPPSSSPSSNSSDSSKPKSSFKLPSSGSDKKKAGFNWISLSLAGGIFAFAWLGVDRFKKYKKEKIDKSYLKSVGKPSIGGPFDLIDQDGKPFTSKDLLGKWVLMYFGFTHCPDVCPEELEKIVKVVDNIDKRRGKGSLIPVFITVDPDRDTPEAIKTYLKEFSTKFIGLTGDKRSIDNVSKRYRVYYSAGPKDKDSDYIVDHTIIMYLIDPQGQFCSYFGQNKTAAMISEDIDTEMLKQDSSSRWFTKK